MHTPAVVPLLRQGCMPDITDTAHACLLGLFGCLCPGISLAVHPQVEAGRKDKGGEGVAYGALDGVDGVKEGEQ